MSAPTPSGTTEPPQPGDPRYERALIVLFSGNYDGITASQARELIDSDEPLIRANGTVTR